MTARRTMWIAGSIVALCVAILCVDYVVAASRAPAGARRILDLQAQTKADASWAPKLAAEQKGITAARLARKKRDNVAAWVLIAAAVVFLWGGQYCPQPPFRRPSRLKAGCGQYCPPHKKAKLPRAPEDDLAFVQSAVAQLGRTKESTIPLLQAIQTHYRYLPDEALRRVCELTEITPAEIAGTSSFYARFRRSPVGEHVIRVCHGTACHVSGARQITEELRRYLAIPEGSDTDAARQFTLDEVACLGCCSLAPMLMVDGHPAGKLTPATACEALRATV